MWAVAPSSYLVELPWVVDPWMIDPVTGLPIPMRTVGQSGRPVAPGGTSMADLSSSGDLGAPLGLEAGVSLTAALHRGPGFLAPHVPGLTDQPIHFDEGPPWPSKSYHVPGWYRRSDKGKVKLLRKYAKEYGRDPRLRAFTINHVLRPAGVIGESRQYEKQARAILAWVQQNIAYLNEPSELLQGPWQTLKVRYGDCDDMALLMASMAETIALPWRLTLAGRKRGTGRPVRWREGEPFPWGTNFFHIYVTFGWPPFKPTTWMSAEPTMRVPLGHDVIAHGVPGGQPGLSGPLAGYFGNSEPGTSPMAAMLPGQLRVTGVTPIFESARELVVRQVPGSLRSWIVKVAIAVAITVPVQIIALKVLRDRRVRRWFKL